MDSNEFSLKFNEFCPKCGSILPSSTDAETKIVKCFKKWCTFTISKDCLPQQEYSFTLNFDKKSKTKINFEEEMDAGPKIEHKCPVCKHSEATYHAMQLRSADEGQTIFYTCTNCKNVTREDS